MPYKDPQKERENARLRQARFRVTEKGKAARRRGEAAYKERYPEKVRAANRERTKRWRDSEKGRAQAARARDQGDPQRIRAYARVAHALRIGLLVKGPCERCGALRVAAHHPHGYDNAHALDVIWLCRLDHKAVHLEIDGSPRPDPADDDMRVEDGWPTVPPTSTEDGS